MSADIKLPNIPRALSPPLLRTTGVDKPEKYKK